MPIYLFPISELREQLQAAEVRKQRLIEAFKKTSQDFREVCYQLTGYRIDALNDGKYRLSPVYAESPDDHLLFQREPTGECMLLETNFSSQLADLIELHLSQQNSIPAFLAAVIMDLFSRQTFDTPEAVTLPSTSAQIPPQLMHQVEAGYGHEQEVEDDQGQGQEAAYEVVEAEEEMVEEEVGEEEEYAEEIEGEEEDESDSIESDVDSRPSDNEGGEESRSEAEESDDDIVCID